MADWSFGCLATLAYINHFGTEWLSGLLMLDGPPRAAAVRAEREKTVARWARENTPCAQVAVLGEQLMFCRRAADFNQLLTEFSRRCTA